MKLRYEYDQDPRYGWASVELDKNGPALIVIHCPEKGSRGFTFDNGEMVPTCICNAWNQNECSCPNVDWEDSK